MVYRMTKHNAIKQKFYMIPDRITDIFVFILAVVLPFFFTLVIIIIANVIVIIANSLDITIDNFLILGFDNSLLFLLLYAALLSISPITYQLNHRVYRTWYPAKYVFRRVTEEFPRIVREMSDLDDLLQYVTHTISDNLETESTSVWLYNKQKNMLILSKYHGIDTSDENSQLTILPVDLELEILSGTQFVDTLPNSNLRYALSTLKIQSITSLNLGGELIGLIGLGHNPLKKQHSHEVLDLLNMLAGQSALAVKNAVLISRLEETLTKLDLAYQRTIDAQENERQNLGTILHDDILGRLMSMTLTLRNCRTHLDSDPEQVKIWLELTENGINEIYRDLRTIMGGLYPSVLIDLGLVFALEEYLDTLAKQPQPLSAPVQITLTTQGFGYDRIEEERLERDIYYIIRQALDNAIKHAFADEIFIHLHWRDDLVSVTVRDTGKGMQDDPEVLAGKHGRVGLLSLQERTRAWKGHIDFYTAHDKGTTVRASIPMEQPSTDPSQLTVTTRHLRKGK
ncbi:MAG: hypothetical protein B6242_01780 [Anaerolineaceae bacterium 4572_78]|nr:MAG: hypothetical protein B6242_01780 [Anaerolineaceae bacterium 4572_78]